MFLTNNEAFNNLLEKYKNEPDKFKKQFLNVICQSYVNAFFDMPEYQKYPLCYIRDFNVNNVIDELLHGKKNNLDDVKVRINIAESILHEASKAKQTRNVQVGIILYVTWIEHWFNDLINLLAITKNLDDKDTIKLINSSFDDKLSYMLPLFGLPKIDNNIVKNIRQLNELRNSIVHYKWKLQSSKEITKYFAKQIDCLNNAQEVVEYLNSYVKTHIFNKDYLKQIFSIMILHQTGIKL